MRCFEILQWLFNVLSLTYIFIKHEKVTECTGQGKRHLWPFNWMKEALLYKHLLQLKWLCLCSIWVPFSLTVSFQLCWFYYSLLLNNPFDHVVMKLSLNLHSLCSKEFTNPGASVHGRSTTLKPATTEWVIPLGVAASDPGQGKWCRCKVRDITGVFNVTRAEDSVFLKREDTLMVLSAFGKIVGGERPF